MEHKKNLLLFSKASSASKEKPTPPFVADTSTAPADPVVLYNRVSAQGDVVRDLKAKKASKEDIDAAVKQLLALKAEYREKTGQEYKPGSHPAAAASVPSVPFNLETSSMLDSTTLYDKVAEQGDMVRKLKAERAPKVSVQKT